MQQFQSLRRLLLFYTLTLFILLSLYYTALFAEIKQNHKQQSVAIFDNLLYEIDQYSMPTNSQFKTILKKPYFQNISYQITVVSPSGQTYVYQYKRSEEPEFNSIAFPAASYATKSFYELTNRSLMGVIHGSDGYEIYVILRHRVVEINWTSYQYWLPLMGSTLLFIVALFYSLKRRADWEQLLFYADNLSYEAEEAYTPPPFIEKGSTIEFLHLGHALSRIKYQLYNNYRQVKTLQHRLERLVDHAPLPMLMIGRQGQISFFNKRFEQIFATAFQPEINYTLIDFIIGSDKATQQLLLNLSLQQVTRTLLVYGLDSQDAYQLHITPWFGEHEQVSGFTGLLSSVNDLVGQNHELLLHNQKLTVQIKEFIKLRSIIGHELRTPLNAIIGTLDLMDKDDLSEEQKQVLMTLIQSSQSMLTMLNDMLDMAKIEAGKVDIVNEPVDIFKLGEYVSDLMIGSTRRKDLDLLYCFSPECPRYITTDKGRLCQILLNLLDNAVKFTTSGYVALTVEVITDEKMLQIRQRRNLTSSSQRNTSNQRPNQHSTIKPKDSWICFSVKDTGIGIAKAEQPKLFSYFNQANPQINQNFGGTGLGLAISNSFAQLLGGFIDLDSESDCGSTFNLYLPGYEPLYQPVYHFHKSLANIHLIAIVKHPLCAHYLQQIGDYLSMTVTTYSDLESLSWQYLTEQFDCERTSLLPVLLLDYNFYQTELTFTTFTPVLAATKILSPFTTAIDPSTSKTLDTHLNEPRSDYDSIQHKLVTDLFFKRDPRLPKILLSKKPERAMASTILDNFDGFLNQPVSITLLLSELIRLTSQKSLTLNKAEKDEANSISNISPLKNEQAIELDKLSIKQNTTSQEGSDKKLILVAEDNITNQKITCRLLTKLGYLSVVAENGEQALAIMQSQGDDIALILMDCRMPIMDGVTATQAIRARGYHLPIVALTANDTDADRSICYAAGMDEFLTKPIQKERLLAVLQRFIAPQR